MFLINKFTTIPQLLRNVVNNTHSENNTFLSKYRQALGSELENLQRLPTGFVSDFGGLDQLAEIVTRLLPYDMDHIDVNS
jgi:hypothetical protein